MKLFNRSWPTKREKTELGYTVDVRVSIIHLLKDKTIEFLIKYNTHPTHLLIPLKMKKLVMNNIYYYHPEEKENKSSLHAICGFTIIWKESPVIELALL